MKKIIIYAIFIAMSFASCSEDETTTTPKPKLTDVSFSTKFTSVNIASNTSASPNRVSGYYQRSGVPLEIESLFIYNQVSDKWVSHEIGLQEGGDNTITINGIEQKEQRFYAGTNTIGIDSEYQGPINFSENIQTIIDQFYIGESQPSYRFLLAETEKIDISTHQTIALDFRPRNAQCYVVVYYNSTNILENYISVKVEVLRSNKKKHGPSVKSYTIEGENNGLRIKPSDLIFHYFDGVDDISYDEITVKVTCKLKEGKDVVEEFDLTEGKNKVISVNYPERGETVTLSFDNTSLENEDTVTTIIPKNEDD